MRLSVPVQVVSCLLLLLTSESTAFAPCSILPSTTRTTSRSSTQQSMAKGFGDATPQKKKQVSPGQAQRDQQATKYDEIASAGGQEYRVFVRPFGMDDDEAWLPAGVVAVPRGGQVNHAIFVNRSQLEASIQRSYPKLLPNEMEFGYNLKLYADDPIEVAKLEAPRAAGFSVGNWISGLSVQWMPLKCKSSSSNSNSRTIEEKNNRFGCLA